MSIQDCFQCFPPEGLCIKCLKIKERQGKQCLNRQLLKKNKKNKKITGNLRDAQDYSWSRNPYLIKILISPLLIFLKVCLANSILHLPRACSMLPPAYFQTMFIYEQCTVPNPECKQTAKTAALARFLQTLVFQDILRYTSILKTVKCINVFREYFIHCIAMQGFPAVGLAEDCRVICSCKRAGFHLWFSSSNSLLRTARMGCYLM